MSGDDNGNERNNEDYSDDFIFHNEFPFGLIMNYTPKRKPQCWH